MSPRLLCFGFGYTAGVLAERLSDQGWRIAGTTRFIDAGGGTEASGAALYPFSRELGAEALLGPLGEASHLLVSIPPDEEGDPVLDLLGEAISSHQGLAWIGYLSTTGVYGDHGGAWVDEEAPLHPASPRSRRRVAAEKAWLALCLDAGLPVHIFRLAGIYGPGRNALEAVRSGKAKRIDLPDQVFGRIHVEDIARTLEASMKTPRPGRIYNVSDDHPAAPADVIEFACGLLGLAPPPLQSMDDAELSPMARSFYLDNKRVSNRRLHEELGLELRYPDYRAGLTALARALSDQIEPL